jgi:putative (di)nucleoside polyphosphate hydrolase
MNVKKNLPLRLGVGVVVLNKENKVFVGKRKDNPIDKWQMPQGGVDEGEDLITAMKRELSEETGIKNITLLKEVEGWSEYELPDYLLGKIWKGKYRGQKQKWFIVRFVGKDNEINLETKNPEFIEWQWVEIDSLPGVIVEFKKKVYENLVPKIRASIN